MPKIDAPTVVEHHAQRRAALVAAATDLLVADGVAAVTPAAVGAATGLARSSVYQYFSSTGALLAAVVEDAFPPANAALAAATSSARTPSERVDAYLRATIELASTGIHRAAQAMSHAEMPQACRDRLRELHVAQGAPLLDAVRELGVPDPELTAGLLQGLLGSAIRAVESGAPVEAVTARTLALIHHGLDAPR